MRTADEIVERAARALHGKSDADLCAMLREPIELAGRRFEVITSQAARWELERRGRR